MTNRIVAFRSFANAPKKWLDVNRREQKQIICSTSRQSDVSPRNWTFVVSWNISGNVFHSLLDVDIALDQCFSNWVPRSGVGFGETKMRNGGRVLVAVQDLYVRNKIRVAIFDTNHSVSPDSCTWSLL